MLFRSDITLEGSQHEVGTMEFIITSARVNELEGLASWCFFQSAFCSALAQQLRESENNQLNDSQDSTTIYLSQCSIFSSDSESDRDHSLPFTDLSQSTCEVLEITKDCESPRGNFGESLDTWFRKS